MGFVAARGYTYQVLNTWGQPIHEHSVGWVYYGWIDLFLANVS